MVWNKVHLILFYPIVRAVIIHTTYLDGKLDSRIISACHTALCVLSVIQIERMAERLRRLTRDLAVRRSIPAALVMCKSLGQALNPHRLCPPSINGYQVERKIGTVNGYSCRKCAAFSPGRWDWKSEFRYLGVIDVKSDEPSEIYGL